MRRFVLAAFFVALPATLLAQDILLLGDVNNDRLVNSLDLGRMIGGLQGTEPMPQVDLVDLNADGGFDVRDVVRILDPINGCETDLDCPDTHHCLDGVCSLDLIGGIHTHFSPVGIETPCGGLNPCEAIQYTLQKPVVTSTYARDVFTALFPEKTIADVVDGATLVSVTAEDGSALAVYRARGTLDFRDATYGDNTVNAEGLTREQVEGAAQAFFTQPIFGGALDTAILASIDPESVRAADGSKFVHNYIVRYHWEADAQPGAQTLMTPIVGMEAVVRVAAGGRVLGFHFDWAPMVEAGTVSVATMNDIRTQIEARPRGAQPALIPDGGASLMYTVGGVTVGEDSLLINYLMDAHPNDESGVHTHNGRTYWQATANRLEVRIISPTRGFDTTDIVDPSTPTRFEAEVTGGQPPYEVTWFLEDAPADAYGTEGSTVTFPLVTTSPVRGNPMDIALAPNKRTHIRVVTTDARGMKAQDQGLLVTGLEAPPGELVGERPMPTGEPVPTRRGCPVPSLNPELERTVLGYGWFGQSFISENEGLVLTQMTFNGSRLAARMNLPNYRIRTAKTTEGMLCTLGRDPGPADKPCRATLVSGGIQFTPAAPLTDTGLTGRTGTLNSKGRLEVRACWCVENLPDAQSDGILNICQVYKFHGEGEGCSPDPLGVACAKWEPLVEYSYETSDSSNRFVNIVTNQRHDYDLEPKVRFPDRVVGFAKRTITGANDPTEELVPEGDIATFNRDFDNIGVALPGVGLVSLPPLFRESKAVMARFGTPGEFDAHHTLAKFKGREASIKIPGCTVIRNHDDGYQCQHSHWRWGKFIDSNLLTTPIAGINDLSQVVGTGTVLIPGSYGNGVVLIPSSQLLTTYVSLFNSDELTTEPNMLFEGDGAPARFFDTINEGLDRRVTDMVVQDTLRGTLADITFGVATGIRFFGDRLGVQTADPQAAARAVGEGFNELSQPFFEQFRDQKGADLVTNYATDSVKGGTRRNPEILQKNAHHFFR